MTADISHPAFKQPKDFNTLVWRYMDFVKYVSMISSGALHFSRVDKLGDPFEGSLTRREFQIIKLNAEQAERAGNLPIFWHGKYFEVLMHSWRAAKKEHYISCWHMNPNESEAMWKLYMASTFGVAIQSKYSKLVEALPSNYLPGDHRGPFVGLVNYIDYETEVFDNNNIFFSLLHKRTSFKHEEECRAIIWKCGNHRGPDPIPLIELENNSTGILVEVKLEDLIEKVIISPNAPGWFSSLFKEITRKYGYNFTIYDSQQSIEPYL